MKKLTFFFTSILFAVVGIGCIYMISFFGNKFNHTDPSDVYPLQESLILLSGFGITIFLTLVFVDKFFYNKNIKREIRTLLNLQSKGNGHSRSELFYVIGSELRATLLSFLQVKKDLHLAIDHLAKENYAEASQIIAQTDKSDEMHHPLALLTDTLIKKQNDEQTRTRISTGMTRFSELLSQTELDLSAFCDKLISELVKFCGYNQGAIFLTDKEETSGDEYLTLRSCYAYGRKKFMDERIEKGTGLLGQCWYEEERIILNEVPADFAKITSGLGEATPRHVVIVPMKYNDRIEGIIELASFSNFDEIELDFIQKISENTAAFIQSKKVNEEIKRLLKVSEHKTQQLLAQEEELRQNSEEILAQREDLERKVRIQQKFIEKLQTSEDNVVINVAGRQRMLSQQMAFFSTMLYHGKMEIKPKLLHAVDLFDHSLWTLENGGIFKEIGYDKIIPAVEGTIKQRLLRVKEIWKPIHECIDVLVNTDYSLPLIAVSKEKNHKYIRHVEDNISVLLDATHHLTQACVEESFSWRNKVFEEMESLFMNEAPSQKSHPSKSISVMS